jgi:DNA-binding transcriptional LysR family regulator
VKILRKAFFQDLLENRIDCAFPALESKGIELISHKLCRLEVGLVLPSGHRLAGRSEIRFERLRNERWILPPRDANPVLYDELISCCHSIGFQPVFCACCWLHVRQAGCLSYFDCCTIRSLIPVNSVLLCDTAEIRPEALSDLKDRNPFHWY